MRFVRFSGRKHAAQKRVVAPGTPNLGALVPLRSPRANDAHGRGLCLVNALADSWAVGPSRFGGTVVWFQIDETWKP